MVDSFEGPMPQTRFVLQKAIELKHRVIIVINKIDRPDARTDEVADEVLELLMEFDNTGELLNSPIVYCSARQGTSFLPPAESGNDLRPLFDTIIEHIPPPEADIDQPLQLLVSSIDYNEYLGRIAIGRIERGIIRQGQEVVICDYNNEISPYKSKIANLYLFEGLKKIPIDSAKAGNIISFSGIEDITIGRTVCDINRVEPLPFTKVSEPTVEMTFSVNDSPFAGKEGKYVTSRHLRERLYRELLRDISLRVEDTDSADSFRVSGRGEMHLSILIENMRREGYEFQVSTPKVLYKEIDGQLYEPQEYLVADIPEDSIGAVMDKLGMRKAELKNMISQGNRVRLEYLIPSRGLFGYRGIFLSDTKGEGILTAAFDSYQPFKGDIVRRTNGSLIAFETGEAVTYGLYNAQERGRLFIEAGSMVYEGMVVGVSSKSEDLVINVCKKKQLTNIRASGSDEALRLTPPLRLSLEQAMEFINDDELLEITPKNIRIRKRILNKGMRARYNSKK